MAEQVDTSGPTGVPDGKEVIISITCDRGLAMAHTKKQRALAITVVTVSVAAALIYVFFQQDDVGRVVMVVLSFAALIFLARAIEAYKRAVRRDPRLNKPEPSSWKNAIMDRCDVTDDMLYFSFRKPVAVSDITSADCWGSTITLHRARQGYKAIKLTGVDHPKEFADLLTALISTRDPRTGQLKS